MGTTSTTTNQPETCCENQDVWVVNSGTEFVCHSCGHRSETGFRPTVSVSENQER